MLVKQIKVVRLILALKPNITVAEFAKIYNMIKG